MTGKISVECSSKEYLKSGIPSIEDVDNIDKLESILSMQDYSKDYLQKNEKALDKYKWIRDSLNQWSRIYEYPYCLEILQKSIPDGAHVLDAGSGVTFFPFYLSSSYNMTCIDQDSYHDIYKYINKKQGTDVNFKQTSLQDICIDDETVDAIYCISVLEHTKNYEKIIEEFNRILKKSGVIIITFDISLGTGELGLNEKTAVNLIETVAKYFYLEYKPMYLIQDFKKKNIYTTNYVKKYKPELLPWPKSDVKRIAIDLLHHHKTTLNPNLTFCNIVARKM
jgi:ubiquinone/menaquinone biosynthesis C-methylase UbiE